MVSSSSSNTMLSVIFAANVGPYCSRATTKNIRVSLRGEKLVKRHQNKPRELTCCTRRSRSIHTRTHTINTIVRNKNSTHYCAKLKATKRHTKMERKVVVALAGLLKLLLVFGQHGVLRCILLAWIRRTLFLVHSHWCSLHINKHTEEAEKNSIFFNSNSNDNTIFSRFLN